MIKEIEPRKASPLAAAIVAVLLGLAGAAQAFTFDTFGDGFWKIINQANPKALMVSATGASQAISGSTDFEQQFELLYNLDNKPSQVPFGQPVLH